MPEPREGESAKEYVARAIPILIEEGYPQKQAVAIAYSMWREKSRKKAALRRAQRPGGRQK